MDKPGKAMPGKSNGRVCRIHKERQGSRKAGMHDKLQQCSHGRHGQQDKGDKEGNVQQGTGEAAKSKTDIWRK